MSKILIIEDEESIAELEKDYLELSGFEVDIENEGDKGLKKALENDYDLYILDLMLPVVDGFEICRQIREQKNAPIIIVSAKKDDIDKIAWTRTWRGRLYDEAVFTERDGGAGQGAHGAV
jgi:DNA-binding response OmpR family regulator